MRSQKLHISELQGDTTDITDLSREHPNDMRTRSRLGGGYGSPNDGGFGNRPRREDSRGGYGRSSDNGVSEEAETESNWRNSAVKRAPLPPTSSMSRGSRQDFGISSFSRSGGSSRLMSRNDDGPDMDAWRRPQPCPAPSTGGERRRFNFGNIMSQDREALPPKPSEPKINKITEEPPKAKEPSGGIMDRAMPKVTSMEKPRSPLPSSSEPEPPRLERTVAVDSEVAPPAKPKKSLATLTERPKQQSTSAHYRPKTVAAATTPEPAQPPPEKKKKKISEQKMAMRKKAAEKAVNKQEAHKNVLGKGSRNDISAVVDKLEAVFDSEQSLTPSELLDSVTNAVENGSSLTNTTLVLACLVALCVREVIHHAEGINEEGLPSDSTGSVLDEMVDNKLLPEARESWERAIPIIEEIKARCDYSDEFSIALIRELIRVCSTSGCPARLSPSITLPELMLLSLMQTKQSLVTPADVQQWVDDGDDDTEGRINGLVQTTNLSKWLKGGLLAESGDEASEGVEVVSDNE